MNDQQFTHKEEGQNEQQKCWKPKICTKILLLASNHLLNLSSSKCRYKENHCIGHIPETQKDC